MKLSIALFACLFSSTLLAETVLRIPLFVEEKNKLVSTAEINKKYNLKGEDKLLEELVVTTSLDSQRKTHDIYWKENGKADEVSSKLNADFYLTMPNPSGCYTGKPSETVDIVAGLTDGPFSDQMGIWGWKYKNQTNLDEDSDQEEVLAHLNQNSAIWKNWKGKDESILILTHESDDGDDIIESVITKCK